MSLIDNIAERMFRKQLTKLQNDIRREGSDFYQALLRYVAGNPIYMTDNVETYINEGYLFNPTVYSVVSFIAQKASTIPFLVYEVKSDNALKMYKNATGFGKSAMKRKALVEIKDHDISHLFDSPNPMQPWSEFIEQTIGFKLVTGNSYTHCIGPTTGPNKGTVKEMWNLPSQIVAVIPGDKMKPIKQYEMAGDRTVVIPPEQVIHLKYWTPEYLGGKFLYGLSPLRAGRRVVSKSNSSFDSWVSSFQNMGALGMITAGDNAELQPLTPEQKIEIEKVISQKTGPKNRGKPLISHLNLKWQQLGMSPVDLNIIESDKLDLRTICNVYHVPSELFNDAANKTYSNTKEAGSAVYTNAVIPSLIQFRDALNQYIQPRYEDKIYVDFDTTLISELQEDVTLMINALSAAWWLTPNERRDMMMFDADEKNPVMSEYWIPMGLGPMSGEAVDDIALDETSKRLGLNDYK